MGIVMKRSFAVRHAGAALFVAAALAQVAPAGAADPIQLAQGSKQETIPGGVENRPSTDERWVPKAKVAPAPAVPPQVGAPAVGATRAPVAGQGKSGPAQKKPDEKGGKGKEDDKSGATPKPLTRGFVAPGAASTAQPAAPAPSGTPTGGDESQPGAVERKPGVKLLPQ